VNQSIDVGRRRGRPPWPASITTIKTNRSMLDIWPMQNGERVEW
jgi:hypothetical protein